ncbi:MAG TPA: DUF1573 domain-containing protein [Chitinophagales bacterium]|nr:DUF1573 domain-containing protein [Chitinophagales bacterium]
MRKLIAFVLVSMMTIGALTSCNQNPNAEPAVGANNADAAAAAANTPPPPPPGAQNKEDSIANAALAAMAKTTAKFDKMEHDFGKIKQGDKVKYSFKLTNTGKEPLVISSAKGSCGCTVPSYPKEPVAPGATANIDVEFDSKGKSGLQTKTVTINANTDPNPTRLTIKADIAGGENPTGGTPATAVPVQPGGGH